MKKVTPEQVRKKIILEDGLLYLDFTASGLAYKPIEDHIASILPTYANTHSEIGHNANITTEHYAQARKSLRESLDIDDNAYIFPAGTGTTGAIKKLQEILGLYIPPKTKDRYHIAPSNIPLVIIGPFEHHSNEISWREALCDTIRIERNDNGSIDLNELEKVLEQNKDREIIGSFSAASNVTGLLNPVKEIHTIMKKYNAIVVFDAAALSPHANIPSGYYDALLLAPHKIIGGVGSCGLLVLKKDYYDSTLPPTFAAGGTVSYVSRTKQIYDAGVEIREDGGTPGILQLIRAAEAYALRNSVGLEVIAQKENELRKYALEQFTKIDGLELYSSKTNPSIGIFSFNIKGFSPYFLAGELSEKYGIQTRAGCSCAGPYGHDLLQYEDESSMLHLIGKHGDKIGWLRVGFAYIHTKEDVDYFFESLGKVIAKDRIDVVL